MSLPPTPVKKRSPSPAKPSLNGDATVKPGSSNAEIVILDSDDEEEGQVKRELSPSAYRSLNNSSVSIGSVPPRSQTVDSEVIDLTLDSDDEDAIVSVPNPKSLKRKSDERDLASPTEQIWKKSRTDLSPVTPSAIALSPTPVPYTNSSASYSPPTLDPTRILPPPSPSLYTNGNGYAPRPSAPTYGAPYIPPGGAPVPVRPPPPPYPGTPPYLAQPNGSSSSSSWRT